MGIWLFRASILWYVATSTALRASAGMTAHASSPAAEAAGTSSDFLVRRAAKTDRKIAISAITHAIAAIQKIVSASG
jgi:hypothetical protein